jgi:DNA-directed RNA polymerase I, II, and III subunit RPABC1
MMSDEDDTSVAPKATAADDEAGADEPDTVEEIDMYRAWKTCREMLTERGYEITDEDVVDSSFEAFKLMKAASMVGVPFTDMNDYYLSINGEKDGGKKKIVVKLIGQNVGIKKPFLQGLCQSDSTNIFVITAKPTKNIITTTYELFRYSEVIFNRTRHRLVPKHELMSKADKDVVLATYDCKESQLPRMLKSDFMARYYGAKSGDMFKIYRPSPSCGTYTTYRMVK